MSALLQVLLVSAVVLYAALSVLRQFWPRGAWQAQARLSYFLERAGRPAWLRRVGVALRPTMAVTSKACGTSCGSCKACD